MFQLQRVVLTAHQDALKRTSQVLVGKKIHPKKPAVRIQSLTLVSLDLSQASKTRQLSSHPSTPGTYLSAWHRGGVPGISKGAQTICLSTSSCGIKGRKQAPFLFLSFQCKNKYLATHQFWTIRQQLYLLTFSFLPILSNARCNQELQILLKAVCHISALCSGFIIACGIPQPIPLKVHFIFRPHGKQKKPSAS